MPDAEKNEAFVGVGSNIDPQTNTKKASEMIRSDCSCFQESRWILTEPDGFKDQPDFLNGAFYLQTSMSLEAFRLYLKDIEIRLGRVKGPVKAGPRTIDLDLIIWNNEVLHTDFYAKSYTRIPVMELLNKLNKQAESLTDRTGAAN